MSNNHLLDLDGQTAPESTRGLFDLPENTSMKWMDNQQRRSSTDINYRSSKVFQRGLHTVNEEEIQQQQRNASPQRKQRTSVTHFNNFPPLKKHQLEEDTRSRADVLAETEAKLSGQHRYDQPASGLARDYDNSRQNRRLSEPKLNTRYDESSNRRMSSSHLDKRSSRTATISDWRSASSSTRPQSTIGVINNHRFSTGSIFDSNNTAHQNNNGHQRKPLFTSHLPFSSVVPHLKSNVLVSGFLRVNKRNRSDAYVFCEDFNADIYICGSRDRNRALEGDHVAIKLIEVDQVMLEKHEKEEAKLARNNGNPVVRKPDEEDEKEIIFGGEEDVDLVTPRFCGVVVAILDRAQKQVFSGTLGLTRPSNKRNSTIRDDQRDSSIPRIIWFKPTDKRVPLIAIPVEQAPAGFIEDSDAFENRLFLGTIKRWPITSLHPFGVLESELGAIQDTHVQLRAILADNNLTAQPYPESFLRSIPLNLLNDDHIEREIASGSRRDLRQIQCFTIVDEQCGFLENALSVQVINEQSTQVGLHVADITAFVGADSALDKEARSRGIDVYHTMPENVSMWPENLRREGTDLVQGQDRFAFSVIWTFNNSGEICDTWYGKTVINSNAVLTAQEMQSMIDSEEEDSMVDDIQTLYSISQILHQERSNRAMFLKAPRLNIRFEANMKPVHIATKNFLPSELVLEEFQILANTQVAQKISSHFPDHALLRSQSLPNERKLCGLTRYLEGLGYTIHPQTPATLQKSIDAIDNTEAKAVIETLVMKSMSQEKYFCIGAFDINRYHHYSMNVPLYTHFTSPMKRYADTIVHRQLEAAINNTQFFFMEPDIVQKTAQHCNIKTRGAENADEQTQHMFSSYYLTNNSGVATNRLQDAIVVGVQEGAFDVIIPDLGLERRIHTINLPLKSDTFSTSENILHLVWMQGEATVDASVEERAHNDDEEDLVLVEIDCLSITEEKKNHRRSTSIRAIQGEDAWVTQKECTFPSECRQLIRPFDFVKVVVTADPLRSPPLIRVLAANPFVSK